MVVFLTGLLTWFAFGFSIAFGVKPDATLLQVAGLSNGWFGDFSGGYKYEDTDKSFYERNVIYNQRRFFVYFAF